MPLGLLFTDVCTLVDCATSSRRISDAWGLCFSSRTLVCHWAERCRLAQTTRHACFIIDPSPNRYGPSHGAVFTPAGALSFGYDDIPRGYSLYSFFLYESEVGWSQGFSSLRGFLPCHTQRQLTKKRQVFRDRSMATTTDLTHHAS